MKNNFDLRKFLAESKANKIEESIHPLFQEEEEKFPDMQAEEQPAMEAPIEEPVEPIAEPVKEDEGVMYEDMATFLKELRKKIGKAAMEKEMELTKEQFSKLEEKLNRLEEDKEMKSFMSKPKLMGMKKLVKEMRKHYDKLDKEYAKKYDRERALKESVEKMFEANTYSSDDMYEVKVYTLEDDKLVATKKIRGRNSKEVREKFEDDFLDDMKKKYGTDLRYKVELAEPNIKESVEKMFEADVSEIFGFSKKKRPKTF